MSELIDREPLDDVDYAQLEQLRKLLEVETTSPYTIFTFACLRIRRLNQELKEAKESHERIPHRNDG